MILGFKFLRTYHSSLQLSQPVADGLNIFAIAALELSNQVPGEQTKVIGLTVINLPQHIA